jgi:hypothetical protein
MYAKIPGTDLDEQYVAFALIDHENFIRNLYVANIIDREEYHNMQRNANKIAQRCGFKAGA